MSDKSLARLKRAQQLADEARTQLGETLSDIQDKFSAANIVSEATRVLRDKRTEVRDQLMSGLVSRPVLAATLLSGAGWALRKKPWLATLLNLFLRGSATTGPSAHSIGAGPQRPRRRRTRAPARSASEENA